MSWIWIAPPVVIGAGAVVARLWVRRLDAGHARVDQDRARFAEHRDDRRAVRSQVDATASRMDRTRQ